jgi:hypothetical protein
MTVKLLARAGAAAALTIVFALSVMTGFVPVRAQSETTPVAKKHLNFIQRHPTMTAVAAAGVTHHMLKVKAARDKAEGKRLNWAERHPTLTAVGAGLVVHHEIKKHTPHQ